MSYTDLMDAVDQFRRDRLVAIQTAVDALKVERGSEDKIVQTLDPFLSQALLFLLFLTSASLVVLVLIGAIFG